MHAVSGGIIDMLWMRQCETCVYTDHSWPPAACDIFAFVYLNPITQKIPIQQSIAPAPIIPLFRQRTMQQPKCRHLELQESRRGCSCRAGSYMQPCCHLWSHVHVWDSEATWMQTKIKTTPGTYLRNLWHVCLASFEKYVNEPVSLRIFPSKDGSAIAATTITAYLQNMVGFLFGQLTKCKRKYKYKCNCPYLRNKVRRGASGPTSSTQWKCPKVGKWRMWCSWLQYMRGLLRGQVVPKMLYQHVRSPVWEWLDES